jgi:hypothetical protein
MTEKSTVRCVTPRCVATIAKYGENYHMVYDRDGTDGVAHSCEFCGAESVNGAWVSRCKHCGKSVDPGTLVGLFVPHSCPDCQEALRQKQIAEGSVCRRCKSAYLDCCC